MNTIKYPKNLVHIGDISLISDSIVISDPIYIHNELSDSSLLGKLKNLPDFTNFLASEHSLQYKNVVKSESKLSSLPVFISEIDANEWGTRTSKKIINLLPEATDFSNIQCHSLELLGVDSGQMTFADTKFVTDYWVYNNEVIRSAKVWGQALSSIKDQLKSAFPNAVESFSGSLSLNSDDAEELARFVQSSYFLASLLEMRIVHSFNTFDTYDFITDSSLGSENSAAIVETDGYSISVSSTGLGDGLYKCLLYTADVEGFGHTNVMLEIIFI